MCTSVLYIFFDVVDGCKTAAKISRHILHFFLPRISSLHLFKKLLPGTLSYIASMRNTFNLWPMRYMVFFHGHLANLGDFFLEYPRRISALSTTKREALLSHPLPPHPEELEVDRKNLKDRRFYRFFLTPPPWWDEWLAGTSNREWVDVVLIEDGDLPMSCYHVSFQGCNLSYMKTKKKQKTKKKKKTHWWSRWWQFGNCRRAMCEVLICL